MSMMPASLKFLRKREREAKGAMTLALIEALSQQGIFGKWVTYSRLLKRMRANLQERGYDQVPIISTNVNFYLGAHFISMENKHDSVLSKRYKGLQIGINYTGTKIPALGGCHSDIQMMSDFFVSKGYNADHFRQLLDDGKAESPTRENMIAGMKWLLEGALEGDVLFLQYSGHGVNVKNVKVDGEQDTERTGFDQAIVPLDVAMPVGSEAFEKSVIRDDELNDILVKNLPRGVKLVIVCDCCHSGSMFDLKYRHTYLDYEAKLQDCAPFVVMAVGVLLAVFAKLYPT